MKTTINTRYLVFPVNSSVENQVLQMSDGDEVLYRINVRLDAENPDFEAYIDVERFRGREVEVTVGDAAEFPYKTTDVMDIPNLYHEPLRPQVHFTTKNGWINDPNGLTYVNGTYHLYYQHNPAGPFWDNMHWGHATSSDLIHWEEQPVALFMRDADSMEFSGCAFVDHENAAGFGKDAVLIYHTVTTKPFTQHLSYSTDGLKTIQYYGEIIPGLAEANRDPKVVWCEEMGCYVMALYIAEQDYGLLKSSDLIHWTQFQTITFPEEFECPDLVPLYDAAGRKRWVFIGAADHYIVGEMTPNGFVVLQEAKRHHFGRGYAGQSYNNLPDDRQIRVVWDTWNAPVERFCGQMGIPVELSLAGEGPYDLQAKPVREIRNLVSDEKIFTVDIPGTVPLAPGPQMITLQGTYPAEGQLKLTVFGCKILLDFDKNTLQVGAESCPISLRKDTLDATFIIDTCSIEAWLDNGKACLTAVEAGTVSDFSRPELNIEGATEAVQTLTVASLKSIWA